MTVARLDDILARDPNLGTLSDVYHRIESAINDPNSSFEAMASVIESDTALAAKVLRIANSSLYALPGGIHSIQRAISIIGTQQLRDLTLAATVIRHFEGMPITGIDLESFWRHSIGCALLARSLASFRREANVERFYVAGLLHDIGRLVMYMHMPDAMAQVLEAREHSQDLLFREEQRELGFHHAQLGGELLERWQLPAALHEPVRCHHDPNEAQRYPVETAVVHAADSMANALRMGSSGERMVPPIDEQAWARIALSETLLEQVSAYTEQHYAQAVEVFLA
ncbi:MAG: HDOD domain-containing protein [Pseudomonadota bacterium]